jgi:hypothetical protein
MAFQINELGIFQECMWLTDNITINFNKNMSTASVFLYTEKAFDTIWHLGLLYKLSTLQFSKSVIKLIGSFLFQRKFSISVEGEKSRPRDTQAGVPKGSIPSPTLYSL